MLVEGIRKRSVQIEPTQRLIVCLADLSVESSQMVLNHLAVSVI